jgi:hypothetical protein
MKQKLTTPLGGVEFIGTLCVPDDLKPGETWPAFITIHGLAVRGLMCLWRPSRRR